MVIKYSALLFSEKGCLFHSVVVVVGVALGACASPARRQKMHEIIFFYIS